MPTPSLLILAAAPPGPVSTPPADAAPAPGLTWLALAMAAAGLVLLTFNLRRIYRRQTAAREAAAVEPRERIDAIRQRAADHDALTSLMVDVEELAQRFAAQLDNKAARLEALLEQADAAIARLEALAGAPDGPMRLQPRRDPRPAAVDGDVDPITRQVYQLADQGHTPVEIARRLSQHTGQIELILALRRS